MGGYVGLAPAGFPNVALSSYAKEFSNNLFVGDLFCPAVPVNRQSFPYVIWNRDNFRVPGSTLRAPGDGATTIRRSYSTDTFFCKSHALKGSVPFEEEAFGQGLGFSTKMQLTGDLSDRIRLAREVEIATKLLSLTNFPNGINLANPGNIALATPATQWDTYPAVPGEGFDGSHPIAQVEACKAILRQAGVQNADMALLLSDPVIVALSNHPDLINRFKYTNPGGDISLDQISSGMKVKCVQASAVVLSQNDIASWVWGNNAFLGYAKPNADRKDMSCAKTFVWAGGQGPGPGGNIQDYPAAPGTIDGYGVLEWLDPELDKKTYWQSVDWYYDIKVTAVETGIPLLNAVSAPVMGVVPGDIEG